MSETAVDLPIIPAIVGPTAAGKSAIAARLAEFAPVTVLSADSRQLYRGFDVGTAKPSAEEQRRVPHRGIDVAAPGERWSAARWAAAAEAWIDESQADARIPLVVGGTGFYLRALDAPLFDEPVFDAERRAALSVELAGMTTDALRERVAALDPVFVGAQRAQLLRAIEVATLAGEPLSQLQRRSARAPRYSVSYLVVDPGTALASRIASRVDAMLEQGWLDEVATLAALVPNDAPAWQAAGYAAWRDHLDGALAFDAARERTLVATRQYAKRQRTWFRHQLPAERVTRVDPDAPDVWATVERWWHRQVAHIVHPSRSIVAPTDRRPESS